MALKFPVSDDTRIGPVSPQAGQTALISTNIRAPPLPQPRIAQDCRVGESTVPGAGHRVPCLRLYKATRTRSHSARFITVSTSLIKGMINSNFSQ